MASWAGVLILAEQRGGLAPQAHQRHKGQVAQPGGAVPGQHAVQRLQAAPGDLAQSLVCCGKEAQQSLQNGLPAWG